MLPVLRDCSKLYNRLSILVTVFITVNLARIRAENCGQEELAKCARPFQVIQSSTDLSIATKKEDLDKICPRTRRYTNRPTDETFISICEAELSNKFVVALSCSLFYSRGDLNNGLQCIRSYTRRCMTLDQRNRFNTLYNGTHQFVRDLCREGEYQTEFLSHAPCLQLVRPDYEVCGRRYHHTVTAITQQVQHGQGEHPSHHEHQAHEHQHQQRRHRNHRTANRTDEDDVQTVCCSFMEYLDCSEAAARNTCGRETAMFTRGFLDKMSSTLIKMYCENYYKSNKCPSAYSSSSSSHWTQLHSVALLLVPSIVSTLGSWWTSSWWTLRTDAPRLSLR